VGKLILRRFAGKLLHESKKSKKEVEWSDIVKGYEYQKGREDLRTTTR